VCIFGVHSREQWGNKSAERVLSVSPDVRLLRLQKKKKASVQSMDRWTSNHATLNGNGCEESLFPKRTRDERESDRD
jgi:hypothetical protein